MEQKNTLQTGVDLEKLIKFYLGFVEFFLALRFITIFLALEGEFANWILYITQTLFTPFSQWVTSISVRTLFTIDFATLTVMLLYVLTAELIVVIFRLLHVLGEKYSHNEYK